MCVKFPLRDLNLDFYPPHLTSTYTCGVTILIFTFYLFIYLLLLLLLLLLEKPY